MNYIQLAYSLEGILTACWWWFCQLVWVGTEGKSSSTICTESSLLEVTGSVFSCLSSRLLCWSIEFISSTCAWIFESIGGGICVTDLPLCCSVQVDAALYKHVFSDGIIFSMLALSESHCRRATKTKEYFGQPDLDLWFLNAIGMWLHDIWPVSSLQIDASMTKATVTCCG